jgi:glycosyltransferase involved in cell wall biosynthesis
MDSDFPGNEHAPIGECLGCSPAFSSPINVASVDEWKETQGFVKSHTRLISQALPDRAPDFLHQEPHSGSLEQVGVIAIIPAYNEELTIGTLVLKTRLRVDYVIVIDDGSVDQTGMVAELAGAEVIRIPKNLGKANAVMRGFARAKEIGCTAVVMLDGDGQHIPEEIPDVLAPILDGHADLVIGSRVLDKQNIIPRYRRAGQKTLDLVTNIGSEYKSTDSQSGFRALSCNALRFTDFKSKGFNIESDMITHFSANGLRISEVPITVRYDVPHKHKKSPLSHGIEVLGHVITLIGYRRPLLTFGMPGSVLVLSGLVISFIAVNRYIATIVFPYGLFIFGTFFIILGMLLVVTALILNSFVLLLGKKPATE